MEIKKLLLSTLTLLSIAGTTQLLRARDPNKREPFMAGNTYLAHGTVAKPGTSKRVHVKAKNMPINQFGQIVLAKSGPSEDSDRNLLRLSSEPSIPTDMRANNLGEVMPFAISENTSLKAPLAVDTENLRGAEMASPKEIYYGNFE